MPFIKIKSLFLAILFIYGVAWANEGGEAEKKEGEDGEKKEAPAATPKESQWLKKTSEVNSKQGQIKEMREGIEGLIKAKNATHDKEAKLTYNQELIAKEKEINKKVTEYNKLVDELRFKFPEKDNVTERKYLPIRPQTIEQIEGDMGLEDKLSVFKEKVDKKYAPFTKELKAEREAKEQAGEKKTEKDGRLKLIK